MLVFVCVVVSTVSATSTGLWRTNGSEGYFGVYITHGGGINVHYARQLPNSLILRQSVRFPQLYHLTLKGQQSGFSVSMDCTVPGEQLAVAFGMEGEDAEFIWVNTKEDVFVVSPGTETVNATFGGYTLDLHMLTDIQFVCLGEEDETPRQSCACRDQQRALDTFKLVTKST